MAYIAAIMRTTPITHTVQIITGIRPIVHTGMRIDGTSKTSRAPGRHRYQVGKQASLHRVPQWCQSLIPVSK
jgi:hypothetical protein